MAFVTNPPTIPLHQLIWEACGSPDLDPKNRLLAHIRIGDLDMHLDAIEVDEDQVAVDPEYEGRLDTICTMEDTNFQTLEIDGRNYVLWATPYGA